MTQYYSNKNKELWKNRLKLNIDVKMNRIGKLMAIAVFVIPYIAVANYLWELNPNKVMFWIFYLPILIGINWIVDKLDK